MQIVILSSALVPMAHKLSIDDVQQSMSLVSHILHKWIPVMEIIKRFNLQCLYVKFCNPYRTPTDQSSY